MAQHGPKRRGIIWCGGLRVALSGLLNLNNHSNPLCKGLSNHAGGRTPAHCDASRISAGVLFRSYQAFPKSAHYLFIRSQILPKSSTNIPKILPKPSQNLPKSIQNRSKIDPKGLLDPILDLCLKKNRFRTPKERPKSAPKCPKDGPDRPKPLPNGAQDPPNTDFSPIFGRFYSIS